ncbi:MAG: lysophospholipid acyltransferase family protein [Candidatus Dormibacteria bacterium]
MTLPPGLRLDGTRSLTLRATQAGLRLLVGMCAAPGSTIEGLDLIPAAGPLLVCSSHLSNFDPLIFGAWFPRVMHAMAKSEMFHNPVLRQYLEHCNCFPVRRGEPDRGAIRAALAVLQSGGALVLFPEGHRSHRKGLMPFEPGAGYLALRAEVPVVPCAVWGTETVLPRGALIPRRAPIHLRVGEPFMAPPGAPSEVSQAIRRRVAALLPAAYRGSAD